MTTSTNTHTRTGKIARLPRAVREELNRRLDDGEQGKHLVLWLNRLPAVRLSLKENFHGQPISEQNLSEWKSGGFLDWLDHHLTLAHARELADNAGEIRSATHGRLADHLATIVTARYATTLAEWCGGATPELNQELRTLHTLVHDLGSLRREDHRQSRVELDRQRLELARQKSRAELVDLFQQWASIPLVRDTLCENWMSPADREIRLRQIFELAPLEPIKPSPKAKRSRQRSKTQSPAPAKARCAAAKATGKPIEGNPAPNPESTASSNIFEAINSESDLIQSKTQHEQWLKDPTAKYVSERQKNITPDDRESMHFRGTAKLYPALASSLAAAGLRMPHGEYHRAAEASPLPPNQTQSDQFIRPNYRVDTTAEWKAQERALRSSLRNRAPQPPAPAAPCLPQPAPIPTHPNMQAAPFPPMRQRRIAYQTRVQPWVHPTTNPRVLKERRIPSNRQPTTNLNINPRKNPRS